MTEEQREGPEGPAVEPEPLSGHAEPLDEPVPNDEQTSPLSPEETEELRRTLAKFQASTKTSAGFKLPEVLGKGSVLRNYEAFAKIGRFALPEGAMTRLAAFSRLSESTSRFSQVNLPDSALKGVLGKNLPWSAFPNLKPTIDFKPNWVKPVKVINSDVYRIVGLGQSNLTALNAVLAKNVDFGFGGAAARLASRFASQQTSWLKSIGPLLEKLKTGFYPSNLEDIEGLSIQEVESVVMLDGIALYGVPRREIAEQLIRAKTTQARRSTLGRRWKAISADCRTAVEGCASAGVASYTPFALAALDALDSQHTKAAQALAASLVDTLVNGYFGNDRYKYTPDKHGKRTTKEYENFTVREFIAFAPLWQAYQKFTTEDGDRVPNTFSRHASVHGVSARQFSRRNAMQALLFATGLLVFLDEEASALEAA